MLKLAGISIPAIVITALLFKNKTTIIKLCNSLKEQIEKGNLYSQKWFENSSLEELESARKLVQQDYNNPNLDLDYREHCWNLLNKFDNAISKIKSNGEEIGYPVKSSHGWYLPSDD